MIMKGQTLKEAFSSIFAGAVIVLCLIAAYLIYVNIMGNPINFEGGNPKGHPIAGNYLGTIYTGGPIVPILMTVNLVLLTFIFERFIMLSRAKGKGNINSFVRKLQMLLNEDKIDA